MQIFSLFIVFSARSLCDFQETDSTRERDSCRKRTIFLVARGQAQQDHASARVLLYFRVPCDEQPARVLLYFWAPCKERHASFLGTLQRASRELFGYRDDKQSPANSRWPLVDDGFDDNKISTIEATTTKEVQRTLAAGDKVGERKPSEVMLAVGRQGCRRRK